MKSEIRIEDGKFVVLVTDVINQVTKKFGPYTFTEVEAIRYDYDLLRKMFLATN